MTALHEPTVATGELRPTQLEIDLACLRENHKLIAEHVAPARVMPVLKANAYGHGLVAVAKLLEAMNCFAIAVAYLEEALRYLEIHGPEDKEELLAAWRKAMAEGVPPAPEEADEGPPPAPERVRTRRRRRRRRPTPKETA